MAIIPLVHSSKLFLLVENLEKSSILRAELQAALTAWLAKPAARPIKVETRIIIVVKREWVRKRMYGSKNFLVDESLHPWDG